MARDAALKLIQDAIESLKEESIIFASSEDAQYFRMTAKKKGGEISSSPAAPQIAAAAPVPVKKLTPPPAPPPVHAEPLPPAVEPLARIPEPISTPDPKPIAPTPLQKPLWRQDPSLSPPTAGLEGWRALINKVAPEVTYLGEIPSDADAKKIAARWKTKNQMAPISVLSYGEPDLQRMLLNEIAAALDVCFGPARLIQAEAIEQEKQWETFLSDVGLKLVIACDYSLWQLKGLVPFYKEIPQQGIRTLGGAPLFLLPDLSLYLKDPLLKRSLWKALCQKLAS